MVKRRNVKRDQFLNFYIHPYEQLIAGLFCLNLADVYSKCLGCQSYQVVIHKIKSSIRIFSPKRNSISGSWGKNKYGSLLVILPPVISGCRDEDMITLTRKKQSSTAQWISKLNKIDVDALICLKPPSSDT